jgi:hypothetical protein
VDLATVIGEQPDRAAWAETSCPLEAFVADLCGTGQDDREVVLVEAECLRVVSDALAGAQAFVLIDFYP